MTATLLLPMGVLAFWLVRGIAAGESLLPVWAASINSVYVSLLAVAAVLLALPVVYYSVCAFPPLQRLDGAPPTWAMRCRASWWR